MSKSYKASTSSSNFLFGHVEAHRVRHSDDSNAMQLGSESIIAYYPHNIWI